MKSCATKLLFFCVLMCVFCVPKLYSQSFVVDNIYYSLNPNSTNTVGVDKSPTCYSGSIVIPETITYNANTYTVTSIHDSAFYGCNQISAISFPATIDTIGGHILDSIDHIDSLIFHSPEPPKCDSLLVYDIEYSLLENVTVDVPCSGYENYRTHGIYNNFHMWSYAFNTVEIYDTVCQNQDYYFYSPFDNSIVIHLQPSDYSGLDDYNDSGIAHNQLRYGSCDVEYNFHIHINKTTNVEYRYYYCNSETINYEDHNFSYHGNSPTTITHHDANIYGCDSTTTLRILNVSTLTGDVYDSVCYGQNYNGTDLTVAWRHMRSTPINSYFHTSTTVLLHPDTNNINGSMIMTSFQQGCTNQRVNYNIKIIGTQRDSTFVSLCEGQNYTWSYSGYLYDANGTHNPNRYGYYQTNQNRTLNSTGFYSDTTLKSPMGCPVHKYLDLIINPVFWDTIYDTVCQGTYYNRNGFNEGYRWQVGDFEFYNKKTSIAGCDSNVYLFLRVNPVYNILIKDTICEGASYTDNGFNISTNSNEGAISPSFEDISFVTSEGYTIKDTLFLQTSAMCDSIVRLELKVWPKEYTVFNDTICQYSNYNSHNFNLARRDTAGVFTYIDSLVSQHGCDSIVTLNLTVNPVYDTTIMDTACQGSVYNNYSFVRQLSQAGDFTFDTTLHTIKGCDSTIHLNLRVNPIYDTTIQATICNEGRYTDNGFDTNKQGLYTQHLYTINGCDSIVRLNLTVRDQITDTLNVSICPNQTYNANGFNVNTQGTYYDTTQSYLGCDSITVLNLNIYPVYDTMVYDTICQNETYHGYNIFNITDNSVAGNKIYVDTLSSINGCDSIVSLNLTVNPVYDTTIMDTACQGSIYNNYSFIRQLSQAGDFTFDTTLHTIKGCDSTIHLNLRVNPIYDTTIQATICNEGRYTDNGFDTNKQGIYTQHLYTINGCDSIVRLNLTVRDQITDTLNVSICPNQTYNANGFNVNTQGTYYDTTQSYLGCDSITVLNLNIYPVYDTMVYDTICQNETYHGYNIFNITDNSVAGNKIYVDTLSSINGCDSIVSLNLTVNPVYDTTIMDTACQGSIYNNYSFIRQLSQAGDFTFDTTLHTIKGCDSTIHLNLRVNPIYDTTIQATICNEGRYTDNGFDTNKQGIYTQHLYTINGCDSIVRLNLTVRDQITDTLNVSICPNQTYNANGFNVNTQGTYYDTTQSYLGCDSITVLNLNIYPVYDTMVYDTICQNETYHGYNIFNITDNSVAGNKIYVDTLSTINGCDSIVSLNLTVNPVYDTTIMDTACQGSIYNNYSFIRILSQAGDFTFDTTLHTIKGCDSTIHLNLRVNPIYDTTIQATICNEGRYTDNGFDTNKQGIYTQHLYTINGCDSIVRLNLTVRDQITDTLNVSICPNQTYNANGFNVNTQGTYYDTTQSYLGCDSITVLNLNIYPVYDTMVYDTICQNETYHGYNIFNITDNSVAGNKIYVDTLSTINGCDSIVSLNLTVNPVYDTTIMDTACQGSIYNNYSFIRQLSQAGDFTFDTTLHTIKGCDSTIHLNLRVNPVYDTTIQATICNEGRYTDNGFDTNKQGIYTQHLYTINGCDSIVRLNLTVRDQITDTLNVSICPNQTYNANGFNVNTQGTYYDTTQSYLGCDSITVLNLNIYPVYDTMVYDTICQNETYHGYNIFNITDNSVAGNKIYVDTLSTINGCDSIVRLNLTVNPVYDTTIMDTACQGSIYNNYSFVRQLSQAGDFTFDTTLHTIKGCDSTIHLNLRVNPIYDTTIQATICNEGRYTDNGFDTNKQGIYTQHLYTINGCDSIVRLNLTVRDQIITTLDEYICQGQTYDTNGFTQSVEGTYFDTLTNYLGCDSVVILNLSVKPVYDTTITAQICANQRYEQNNFSENTQGIFTQNLQTIWGCDSIVHLDLTIFPLYFDTFVVEICDGETYVGHGFRQNTQGYYFDTLQSIHGCDSVQILDLTVHPTYIDTIYADICQGDTFSNDIFTQSQQGIYKDTLFTTHGCDSIFVLNLTVHPLYDDTIFAEICEGDTYNQFNFNETQAGTYTQHLQTIWGCDSLSTLSLTVHHKGFTMIIDSTCDNVPYTDNGFNVSSSGVYWDTLANMYGCDSVVKLVLVVYPSYDTLIKDTICWGEQYTLNGFNQSQTGFYTQNLQSIKGCDSIVHLDLTALVYHRNIERTICQGGTIDFNGMIISEAGIYTDTLYSVNTGCDSIITLTLKNYLPYTDTIHAEICQGESYSQYGFHEHTAGLHLRTLQTAEGCDSIIVLDLKVLPTYHIDENAEICEGERYSWHGYTLTKQGAYKDTMTTYDGCDSIITLHLRVNPNYNDTIDARICKGEVYSQNGFNADKTGQYILKLQSSQGCDSTVLLNLQVNRVDTTHLQGEVCQGDIYSMNGFYVNTAGEHFANYFNNVGCDSVVILHLTVNPTYTDTIETTIHRGEFYNANGFYEIDEGDYYQHFETEKGCDSTVMLRLHVDDPYNLWVPNAFMPVNHVDNVFYAYTDNEDVRIKSFKIFDRWGTLLFETDDIKQGWNGKYKDKYCQQGTYVYQIFYYNIETPDMIFEKKGTLMLLY